MGDPAFADVTDFGIADMFRLALRERSEAEHMNPVLHQACVYRAAALGRELAIRNAREQARLDAEAAPTGATPSLESTDERFHPERIRMAVRTAIHAHDAVMIDATDRDDIAERVVAALCGPPDERVPPADCVSIGEMRGAMATLREVSEGHQALVTRLRVLVDLWEREYGASAFVRAFARDITAALDGADVGPIATCCPPDQPGDLGADVLESLIPDPVDVGPDPSGTLIDEIAARLVTVTRGHLVALVLEVQRRRSERDADKRIAAEIQTEIERMTKLLEHAKMARESGAEQSALDRERVADVVRRVVRARVASVEGWSGFSEGSIGRMIGDIAEHCADLLATPAVQLSAGDIDELRAIRSDLIDAWESGARASRRSGMPPGVAVIDRLIAHGAKP